jgi:hypothetical protein
MPLCYSGCSVLPNMNVLLAGSSAGSYKMFSVYNVTSNTWPLTTNATVNVFFSSLLLLGKRVMTIPHLSYSTVTEYNYLNNSATNVGSLLNLARPYFAGAISVPAVWFAYLPNDCIGVE